MIDHVTLFFVVLIAIAAVLANIGVWAPRKLWVRLSAVAVAAVFIPVAYATVADLLSRPKPVALEWLHRNAPEAKVLSARIDAERGIYLWLQLPGAEEPRAYVLAYNEKLARQLQQAQNAARRNGRGVRMKNPFRTRRDDGKPPFYAPPQPPRPPKASAESRPFIFPHPGPRS